MAFPLTHLLVAKSLLEIVSLPGIDSDLFLLGSIAPDGVHYRKGFVSAGMGNIGAQKKITHLCPVSNERWGQVTDNEGWEACVSHFLRENPNDSLCTGYAVHILTDIYNNTGIWDNFRTKHPEEAAKGYASDYYRDLKNIDIQLYFKLYKPGGIEDSLRSATARDLPGLVTAEEIHAIRDSLLYDQYSNVIMPTEKSYGYLTYGDVLAFIKDAAAYCAKVLSTSVPKGA